MSTSFDSPGNVLAASYAACHRRVCQSRSSFHAAFRLLPKPKHRAMEALYAFARESDDLVDSDEPVEQRCEKLDLWRAALERHLATGPGPHSSPLLPALADTVARYAIPHEYLLAVLDGVAMDLDRCHYETFDQLAVYCQRVASAVGLASMHIWGFTNPQALEPADHCGLAFQLTNILRDVREDARLGRVYLPEEDLRAAGCDAEQLRNGVADDRFLRLMYVQIARARAHYDRGRELRRFLHPDGQRIFGLMCATYRALLEQIARDPAAVLHRRVRLPRWRKLALFARWSMLPITAP